MVSWQGKLSWVNTETNVVSEHEVTLHLVWCLEIRQHLVVCQWENKIACKENGNTIFSKLLWKSLGQWSCLMGIRSRCAGCCRPVGIFTWSRKAGNVWCVNSMMFESRLRFAPLGGFKKGCLSSRWMQWARQGSWVVEGSMGWISALRDTPTPPSLPPRLPCAGATCLTHWSIWLQYPSWMKGNQWMRRMRKARF